MGTTDRRTQIQVSLVLAALLASCPPAYATRSAQRTMPDPISEGQCSGLVALSYGSYIYQWPSKLDQVFWPDTDPSFIWFCPSSGLTAFQPEIEQLSEGEKQRVKEFLATGYKAPSGPPSLRDKLVLLEGTYGLLDTSEEERIWLLRVLAYLYEAEVGDQATADRYRITALRRIQAALATNLEPKKRLQYLFLAERYERLAGDRRAAKARMSEMRHLARNVTGEARDYGRYLTAIQEEQYGSSVSPYAAGLGLAGIALALLAMLRLRRSRAGAGRP